MVAIAALLLFGRSALNFSVLCKIKNLDEIPHGYPPGDPRRDETKADWIKESKSLRELYQQWNG